MAPVVSAYSAHTMGKRHIVADRQHHAQRISGKRRHNAAAN